MQWAFAVNCLEDFLPVTIPKHVTIHNLRLGLLLLSARLAVFFLLMSICIKQKAWNTHETPVGSISFWIEPSGDYFDQQYADFGKTFCDASQRQRYDYQYDAAGNWRYTDVSCANASISDSFLKGDTTLFLPTFFQETNDKVEEITPLQDSCEDACAALHGCQGADARYRFIGSTHTSGNCLCLCRNRLNRFLTGVESLNVSFSLAVQVRNFQSKELISKSSHDEIKTIVRDTITKQVILEFDPGQPVSIQVSKILEIAKVNSLDERLTSTQQNLITVPEAQAYPVIRMTGLQLDVSLMHYNKGDKGHNQDHEGSVCYLEINAIKEWSGKPITAFGSGMKVGERLHHQRYYYGILLTFRSSGSYSFPDWTGIAMLTFVGTAIVYMQVPTYFLTFLMQYGLGGLSLLYRNATLETLTSLKIFQGTIARALSAQCVFRCMAARSENVETAQARSNGLAPALSKPILHRELHQLFENRLEEEDYVMVRRLLRQPISADTAQPRLNQVVSDHVTDSDYWPLGNFVSASLDSDMASLEELAHFFKISRPASFLERMFDSSRNARLALIRSLQTSGDRDLGDAHQRQLNENVPIGADHNVALSDELRLDDELYILS